MAKVIVTKDTAVNRAGAKVKKAVKDATAVKGRKKSDRSDILYAGNKIGINPGKNAEKAAGNMTRKARKAK